MHIAIYGAGSTGCYIGGMMSLAGHQISLIGRPTVLDQISQSQGIFLSDYAGRQEQVAPPTLLSTLGDEVFDLVFVSVKCHHLESAVDDLVKLSQTRAALIFMQNGLGSLEAIRPRLKGDRIFQGITPFNVLSKANARFHRGTEGDLQLPLTDETKILKHSLNNIGYGCELYDDMRPIIYGKLLLNLNNALNAISGLPLKTELEDRRYRKVLAAAMEEWLQVCKKQNISLRTSSALPSILIPHVLRLPNSLFRLMARAMLAIDPEARSSMWEDLQAERQTEIHYLNGAVVKEARRLGLQAPTNQAICQFIAAKEQGQEVDINRLF